MPDHLSIIIPVAPNEDAHEDLVRQLNTVEADIIVVSEGSRARSMNFGASQAKGDYIWFLHADSRLDDHSLAALKTACEKLDNNTIYYFDLAFFDGILTRLNAWGANIRSRILKAPYGDQGFFMARDVFDKVGGFCEDVKRAEDLHFILKARADGVKICPIDATLYTSARRYQSTGWLRLTFKYQKIFWSIYLRDVFSRFRRHA